MQALQRLDPRQVHRDRATLTTIITAGAQAPAVAKVKGARSARIVLSAAALDPSDLGPRPGNKRAEGRKTSIKRAEGRKTFDNEPQPRTSNPQPTRQCSRTSNLGPRTTRPKPAPDPDPLEISIEHRSKVLLPRRTRARPGQSVPYSTRPDGVGCLHCSILSP
jgi:hypothetical protein